MSVFRNVLTVGGATLVSRVLGFVRDTLIAAGLGTGPVADAFFVAFRLPNLFRRLFAEGAFAAAFVPLFVRVRDEEGGDAARRFAGEAMVGLVAVVVSASVVAMVFAPELVALLAPGFVDDPAKFALTVALTRLCFPYLAAISCVALLSGVLGAHRRFLAPSLAPVLLNGVLISALVGLLVFRVPPGPFSGTILSVAVCVAGFAQLLFLVVVTARVGLAPRLAWSFGPRIARLARLALPGLLAGGLTEINIVVGTMIASGEAGAVSWLYYADRLHQLPLGVIGIAVGQVLLPEIANVLGSGRPERVFDVQNRALELALALALPAAVALAVLAGPIVTVLFERGAFGALDGAQAARALFVFALGLPSFVLVKVLSPGFFARGDTHTPMVLGAIAVAVNIALALGLMPALGWIAVAIATSAAGWVNAVLLGAVLAQRGHWRPDGTLVARLPRLFAATALLGLGLAAAGEIFAPVMAAAEPLVRKGGALALLVMLGLSAYGGLVVAFGVIDRAEILRLFAREPRPPAASPADPACPPPLDRA